MTTLYNAADVAVQHWLSEWASATPTALEGDPHDPAEGASLAIVTITEPESMQSTQGAAPSRRFLRIGQVRIELKTPVGQGSKAITQLAHTARGIFESKRVGELRFHGGAVVTSRETDGMHLVRVITCRFDYQEIK